MPGESIGGVTDVAVVAIVPIVDSVIVFLFSNDGEHLERLGGVYAVRARTYSLKHSLHEPNGCIWKRSTPPNYC
jgi:hypothetical protein